MKQQETVSRVNLVTGEDSYSGQNAQNPATARKLQSLIPSIAGELTRELGEPLYLSTNLGGKVGALVQYDYNDASGNQQTKRFAATATSIFVENPGLSWNPVSLFRPDLSNNTLSPLQDYPQFVIINNLLHMSDGFNSWIFDGPNNQWIVEGFPIPFGLSPGSAIGAAGNITTLVDKFYWFTWADETPGRVHESSSSGISASLGAFTSKQITVTPFPGTISSTGGSTGIIGVGTSFNSTMIGLNFYGNGTFLGIVASVTDALHLTLTAGAAATLTGAGFLVVPVRATHIHIYGSETDGSRLGMFHGKIAVTANPPTYTDNTTFTNQAASTILNIDRPIRNDPPPASRVLEVHKYRIWRRRETIPNRFNYSANEEVGAEPNGSPQESVPGTNVNTLSDLINETAYPKPALSVRALKSHGDALYLATEKEIIPLWGDTIGQFSLSQVTAIDGGAISRWGMESSSHGLIVFSYDRKLYIYPPVSPIWALTPQDINVTDQLVEIGRPMRNKFLTILGSDIQNVRILKYRYNVRDWLVVCYQDNTNTYHTFIYDFETKGWFELQKGFVSVVVFETSPGIKILVGGGTDGLVHVLDDVTGSIVNNLSLPTALYRTALIDFGAPDRLHLPDYLEVEVDTPALMDSSTTINFYLDPPSADAPGTPIALPMSPVRGFPNLYRGFFSTADGGTGVACKRLLIEFNLASDTNQGKFRGIHLKADPISEMIT